MKFSQYHSKHKQRLHTEFLADIKGLELEGCSVSMPTQWYKQAQEYTYDVYTQTQ